MPTGYHDNSMLPPSKHVRLLYRMSTFSACLGRSSDRFAIFRNSFSFFLVQDETFFPCGSANYPFHTPIICHFVLATANKNVLKLITSSYLKKKTEKNEITNLVIHVNLLMRNNQQICDCNLKISNLPKMEPFCQFQWQVITKYITLLNYAKRKPTKKSYEI